ncbi:MAG: phosphotriesterase [Actinomycetes bacterium]
MERVPTLRGETPVDELGITLMHEHLFVLTADRVLDDPPSLDHDVVVPEAVRRLTDLYDAGVRTIADPSVIGHGRDIRLWREVGEQVLLNIIPATGFYTYRDLPFGFRFRSDEELVDYLVRDITKGIGGSEIKAGFLKCAVEHAGFVGDVERVLRACARAHLATGVPITVHTNVHAQNGRDVARVLREEGVDPHAVVIGHSGDSTDMDYLTSLADEGYYLGMDRFGIDMLLPFEQRVATVAEMCARGYAELLVLAHDASCHTDWFPHEQIDQSGNWSFTHISNDVLPALRERGVSEEQITTMLVENPRRYFTGTTS